MTTFWRWVLLETLGAALLASLAAPATAQVVTINELRPLRPDAVVEIEVVEHSVTIMGWDRDEIEIVGEYDSAFEELEVSGGQTRLRFNIHHEGRRRGQRRAGSESLSVRVPRGVRLIVESVSGYLDVDGITGSLTAETVTGSVEARGNLASVFLESVSGSVRYRGNAPTVRLESVSGTNEFNGTARDVTLESISGSVEMRGGAETIAAETVSGGVRVESDTPVMFLSIASVSGQVRFEGTLGSGGRIEAESHSGTVDLTLGPDTDAEFELGTFSGGLSADVTGMRDEVQSRGRGPGQRLTFTTRSGAGRVRANSFSGSVRISGR